MFIHFAVKFVGSDVTGNNITKSSGSKIRETSILRKVAQSYRYLSRVPIANNPIVDESNFHPLLSL